MTCIVALETPNGVWMGADRLASGKWTGITLQAPKVFTNGPAMFGVCGSVRQMQLLQYSLTVSDHGITWDVDRWVAHDLAWAIRHTFDTHGAKYVKDGVDWSGNYLLAIRGRAYELQSDYSFTRSTSGEYAIGSGEEVALGSLHATRGHPDPQHRILAALEAAAEHVVSVAGPFDIVHQEATT